MIIHGAGVFVANLSTNTYLAFFSKKSNYKCGFPFGKCEEGENPRDTAIRECLEETGLIVSIFNKTPFVKNIGNYDYAIYEAVCLYDNPRLIIPESGEGYPAFVPKEFFMNKSTGRYPGWNKACFDYFKHL